MFYKVHSCVISGIEALPVNVEIDVSKGIPVFEMTGSLATQVKEAKERVKISIKNSGYTILPGRITVNISPADIRKAGTLLDLPIAVGILGTLGFLNHDMVKDAILVGELSLDGKVGMVSGILPIALEAKKNGYKRIIVPFDNGYEAGFVKGIDVVPVKSLKEVVDYLTGRLYIEPVANEYSPLEVSCDTEEIIGQTAGKRATVIAAAGMHNIIYMGPPGVGKTMLAKLIPRIMSPLTLEESLELSKVYSVCGLIDPHVGLIRSRPFRTPYSKLTVTGLLGGGCAVRPGEVSLGTFGVLFLDELPLFKNSVLNSLRVPLEERKVIITRNAENYIFPADFVLAGAMNPCACGYYPDREKCRCSKRDIEKYLGRIDRPFWDRIDICVEVPKIDIKDFKSRKEDMSISDMKDMVKIADRRQELRYKNEKIRHNSELDNVLIKKYANLSSDAEEILNTAFERMDISMRAYNKIIKVARTIADADDRDDIEGRHMIEAISLRVGEANND